MSVRERGVKPASGVKPGSNSPELTRGSSPAGPETAERCGFPPPAAKRAAEGLYGMPRLARI